MNIVDIVTAAATFQPVVSQADAVDNLKKYNSYIETGQQIVEQMKNDKYDNGYDDVRLAQIIIIEAAIKTFTKYKNTILTIMKNMTEQMLRDIEKYSEPSSFNVVEQVDNVEPVEAYNVEPAEADNVEPVEADNVELAEQVKLTKLQKLENQLAELQSQLAKKEKQEKQEEHEKQEEPGKHEEQENQEEQEKQDLPKQTKQKELKINIPTSKTDLEFVKPKQKSFKQRMSTFIKNVNMRTPYNNKHTKDFMYDFRNDPVNGPFKAEIHVHKHGVFIKIISLDGQNAAYINRYHDNYCGKIKLDISSTVWGNTETWITIDKASHFVYKKDLNYYKVLVKDFIIGNNLNIDHEEDVRNVTIDFHEDYLTCYDIFNYDLEDC